MSKPIESEYIILIERSNALSECIPLLLEAITAIDEWNSAEHAVRHIFTSEANKARNALKKIGVIE